MLSVQVCIHCDLTIYLSLSLYVNKCECVVCQFLFVFLFFVLLFCSHIYVAFFLSHSHLSPVNIRGRKKKSLINRPYLMSLFRRSFVQIILLCHIDTYTYGLESKQEKSSKLLFVTMMNGYINVSQKNIFHGIECARIKCTAK